MRTSEKTEQVAASLFAVHRDLANPRKDAKGQVRGRADYRYLSLPALIDYLRPKLKDAQLFVTQELVGGQGTVECTTTVWHLSGQHIEFGPIRLPAPNDPQQVGSAATYARRYALAAVFNLAADEDDDAASARPSEPTRRHPSGAAAETSGRGTPATSSGGAPQPDAGADKDGPATDTEQAPESDSPTFATGEGATPNETRSGAAPVDAFLSNRYLTPEDQALLKVEYGSPTKALKVYRARFGERIQRLGDITYEMRDEMGAA